MTDIVDEHASAGPTCDDAERRLAVAALAEQAVPSRDELLAAQQALWARATRPEEVV